MVAPSPDGRTGKICSLGTPIPTRWGDRDEYRCERRAGPPEPESSSAARRQPAGPAARKLPGQQEADSFRHLGIDRPDQDGRAGRRIRRPAPRALCQARRARTDSGLSQGDRVGPSDSDRGQPGPACRHSRLPARAHGHARWADHLCPALPRTLRPRRFALRLAGGRRLAGQPAALRPPGPGRRGAGRGQCLDPLGARPGACP